MGTRAGQSPERRPRSALGGFAATSLAWCVVLLALRVYEVALVRSSHLLPEGAAVAELRGVLSDLVFALVVAALLALPVLALTRWSPVAAHRLHRTALALIAMATVALSQYFAATFVPLGADLLGYSWAHRRALAIRRYAAMSASP